MRLLVLLLVGVACSEGTSGGDPLSVAVFDNYFAPATLTISVGQTVTWVWQTVGGGTPHNVVFLVPDIAPANCPTTAIGVCSRTFPSTGTFDYTCNLHAGMNGRVIVR